MSTMLNQVERACIHLTANVQPITISAVGDIAGISRSTIHRHEGLRAVIENHRDTALGKTITALTEEIATLRATLTTLANTVRRHDTQLRRLTEG